MRNFGLFLQDWIGNNRKKISGRKRNRAKNSNCSIRKRKRTARDMFQEDFLKSKLNIKYQVFQKQYWTWIQHGEYSCNLWLITHRIVLNNLN